MNFQFGGGGDWLSWIAWFVFMMVFFLFYPRIMLSQIMWKLEKTAEELEDMAESSKKFIIKSISKKAEKRIKEAVTRFFEFFVITPVSLDPYGIIRKLDHIIKEEKDRFEYFVDQVAPDFDSEKKACLRMGLAGGISVYEISKVVRHYVELVRKTKNIQIAMVLQMQLPMIERIAKAMFKGTQTLTKGEPVGDGIGPLIAAYLMGNKKPTIEEDDVVGVKTKIEGRDVFVLKAKGPGGRTGFPGKVVKKLVEKNGVKRIITIDAAAKLEGEKTGSVAEGVGVAMGGVGVERSYIEEAIVKKGVAIDSVIVKMSQEEAITPMKKTIKDALPEVVEAVKRGLERVGKNGSAIVLGVGNTSGIGNSRKEAEKAMKWVDKYHKRVSAKKKSRI